ncbi:MAG: hypothetical protein P4M11_04765 [Candidatus Pacebacteria bacterium]|nr:hypothetical protein [Candidatus Paceibacterota bacterium]
MGCCTSISVWLFDRPGLRNRLWECDTINPRFLLVLRCIVLLFLIEICVMAIIAYALTSPQKVFSITSVSILCSLTTYVMILVQHWLPIEARLWKWTHVVYEISFSFAVGLSLVFWCVLIPLLFTRSNFSISGLQNTWLEIAVRVQFHTIVFGVYLFELYMNRIEFPFRHIVIVFTCCVFYVIGYLALSKLYRAIEDYTDWSDVESFSFIGAAGILILGSFCCAALITEKKLARYTSPPPMRDVEKSGKDRGLSMDSI